MRLFYFNIHNSLGYVPATEGLYYADIDGARAQAVLSIRSILADEVASSGVIDLRGRIEIVDEDGALVTVQFVDAVELRQGQRP